MLIVQWLGFFNIECYVANIGEGYYSGSEKCQCQSFPNATICCDGVAVNKTVVRSTLIARLLPTFLFIVFTGLVLIGKIAMTCPAIYQWTQIDIEIQIHMFHRLQLGPQPRKQKPLGRMIIVSASSCVMVMPSLQNTTPWLT